MRDIHSPVHDDGSLAPRGAPRRSSRCRPPARAAGAPPGLGGHGEHRVAGPPAGRAGWAAAGGRQHRPVGEPGPCRCARHPHVASLPGIAGRSGARVHHACGPAPPAADQRGLTGRAGHAGAAAHPLRGAAAAESAGKRLRRLEALPGRDRGHTGRRSSPAGAVVRRRILQHLPGVCRAVAPGQRRALRRGFCSGTSAVGQRGARLAGLRARPGRDAACAAQPGQRTR